MIGTGPFAMVQHVRLLCKSIVFPSKYCQDKVYILAQLLSPTLYQKRMKKEMQLQKVFDFIGSHVCFVSHQASPPSSIEAWKM